MIPLIETIAHLSQQIKALDVVIENLGREKYPVTAQLRQVAGVGPVTSFKYILTIGNPKRFARSRDVGAYLGLTPRRCQSGETDPQLKISKAGNKRLRFLLVQCAQFVLGRFGAGERSEEVGTDPGSTRRGECEETGHHRCRSKISSSPTSSLDYR